MNDINISKDVLYSAITQELQSLGLKNGIIPKRSSKHHQTAKSSQEIGLVFSKPLQRLSSRTVTLSSGVRAEVPVFIFEVCSYILEHTDVEGLFRKAGSAVRQKQLKAAVNEGHRIDFKDHHVIDVANLLKYFLRELPEPLLPFAFHDTFLHCLLSEDVAGAVLLVCLLLPQIHLHVLAFVMEFFRMVTTFSSTNKMDCNNLAIVLAPSVMPITTKLSIQNPQRLNGHVRVVELLIANAARIGVLPDGVTNRLSLTSSNLSFISDEQNLSHENALSVKKKRRRSGSLTRMFNGLKKIVGKGSPDRDSSVQMDEQAALISSTPDFPTPCMKASKKRKADSSSAFSSKKKRDVLQALPQSTTLASTPFKHGSQLQEMSSHITPRVSSHPNPMSQSPTKVSQRKCLSTQSELEKLGVPHSHKVLATLSGLVSKKQQKRGGSFLERSWSAVSSGSTWRGRRGHRRLSLTTKPPDTSCYDTDNDPGIDLSGEVEDRSTSSPMPTPEEGGFVRVPRTEYNQLKSRMSAIESRISQEFGSFLSAASPSAPASLSPDALRAPQSAVAVQTAYEKTLEGADISKDTSTDLLAKRLSRELKIRRSGSDAGGGRVIRSPSARKIGSLRRRSSRSRERQELRRNRSWHSQSPASTPTPSQRDCAASSLRRGRPNTVLTGLRHPSPSRITRRTSFHAPESSRPAVKPTPKKCSSQVTLAKAALLARAKRSWGEAEPEAWGDARALLGQPRELLDLAQVPVTGRESIARIRNENAGKVLATARLFSASRAGETPVLRRSLGAEAPPAPAAAPAATPAPVGTEGRDKGSARPAALQRGRGEAVHKKTPVGTSSRLRDDRKVPLARMEPSQARAAAGQNKLRKHSSLKSERRNPSQPVKRNISAPVQAGKENAKSPRPVALLAPSTKMSVSPLKDCNRISVQARPQPSSTTPSIKQPLTTTRSPHPRSFTPQSARSNPSRFHTPLVPSRRQSPRILHQNNKFFKQP